MRARERLLLGMVLLLSGCTGRSDESSHLPIMARLIAANLDSVNGLPTAILDRYRCNGDEPCIPVEFHAPASAEDAEAMVATFSVAAEIPVISLSDGWPDCAWGERSDPERIGLWAEFYTPRIDGDTAIVWLATSCADYSEGFEQIHEFEFTRTDKEEWEFVARRLASIT